MQYQIYLDVLLLTNFIMDFLALQLTNRWRKRTASKGFIILASLFGSVSASVLVLIVNLNGYMKLGILYAILIPIMNWIAFSSRRISQIAINSGTTIVMMVLLTGFLNVCYTHIPFLEEFQLPVLLMILIAIGIYLGSSHVIMWHQSAKECVTYQVFLSNGDEKLEVVGLMDTGNSLMEPISQKPVCMIERDLIQGKEVNGIIKGFCIIPFHSVGKEHGILEGFEVDELTIMNNGIRIIHKEVIVAVAPSYITNHRAYKMILHPQLLQ